jgi:hypothetical protein
MRPTRIHTGLIVLSLLMLGACSDDGDTSKLPCPPKGIGIEEFQGISPSEQFLKPQQFACAEPQICPDLDSAFPSGPLPAQVSVGIKNCSTGNKKLAIEKVAFLGDDRCSYTCAARQEDPSKKCQVAVEKSEVDPGETISIMMIYNPQSDGEDHAQFRIFSNAQNFPSESPLKIPTCAFYSSTADDAGVADSGAGVTDAGVDSSGEYRCKEPTEVNTQCHKDI